MWGWPRPLWGLEAVPHAWLGQQVAGPGWLRLKLAAKLGDVNAQVVALRLVLRAPYLLQQLPLGDEAPGGPVAGDRGEAGGPVSRGGHLVVACGQVDAQRAQDRRLVVDHQDPCHAASFTAAPDIIAPPSGAHRGVRGDTPFVPPSGSVPS